MVRTHTSGFERGVIAFEGHVRTWTGRGSTRYEEGGFLVRQYQIMTRGASAGKKQVRKGMRTDISITTD